MILTQESWYDGSNTAPDRVTIEGRNDPASSVQCWSKPVRDTELGSLDANNEVNQSHGDDGDHHSKVRDVAADLGGEEVGELELFQVGGDEESSNKDENTHQKSIGNIVTTNRS